MRRPLLYALLALVVPLPAFALDGTGTPEGPVNFGVSASLGGCGLADTSIVCQIDASWDAVDGADYYSVSVSRPDGSVVDYGQTGGGGATLWVPYVGSGGYGVQVTAWGTPPGEDKPEVIAHDQVGTLPNESGPIVRDAKATVTGASAEALPTDPDGEVVPGEEPAEEPPAGGEPAEEVPPVVEPPVCEETPPEPEPAPVPAEPAEGEDGYSSPGAAAVTQALEAQGEVPEVITCP